MSLLNNMLRDLQTRGALGVEPLTGLEPVVELPTKNRRRALILPALAALAVASALVLWRPVADGRSVLSFAGIMVDADAQPQSEFQTVPQTSPQAEPDPAAGGDTSRGVFPINRTDKSSPAPLDDQFVDTAADSPPADFADQHVVQVGADADAANAAPLDDYVVNTAADSPPADLADQHVVQLAVFADPANAAPLLKILQQKGFPNLTRSMIDAAGRTLTRVLAGPYANRSAALSAKEALEADGWLGYVRIMVDANTQPPSEFQNPAKPSPQASPGTATILRRETGDAATAAAGPVTRGLAAVRGNDLLSAERLFREALAVDSGDHAIWSYLYSVLVRASKPAAAEQALQRGLISAKEPAPLAKLYARTLLDRGEKDAAVSILRTHRPVSASDAEYDAFLAAVLQQLGQYAEAGEIYRTLLTVEPGAGSWWVGLAMSCDSLGNRPDALSAFQRALRTASLKTPLARYARRRTAELQAYD